MELEKQHIAEVKIAFKKMQTKHDLLDLLNKVGEFSYGANFKKIELHKLTYYSQNFVKEQKDVMALLNFGHSKYDRSKNAEVKRYTEFTIKKKSGKDRLISAPIGSLKTIQRCLKLIFEIMFIPHHRATGFIIGKSIIDNAKLHVGKNYVYNIDLKDFFPSITYNKIKWQLHQAPFSLDKTKNSAQENLAFIITKLCTQQIKDNEGKSIDVLPQGAPTSPILSNIICQTLDRRLHGLAKKYNVNYSRYADDITFSSDHSVYSKDSEFIVEMNRIITDQKLTVNKDKVRLQRKDYRQEVTGITVNQKPNVGRKYVKTIRAILHNWEKSGYSQAEKIFLEHYTPAATAISKKKPNMRLVIQGKLDYLKMVKGEDNNLLNKLLIRFNLLINKRNTSSKSQKRNEQLDSVLKLLIHDGLEAAMKNY